jgi:predicted nucleic acid-binding Zn ribbon protein
MGSSKRCNETNGKSRTRRRSTTIIAVNIITRRNNYE